MKPDYVRDDLLNRLIDNAISEDVGDGDHTSLASVPQEAGNKARLIAKEAGVVAGLEVGRRVFERIDKRLIVTPAKNDGERVMPGDVVLTVEGPAASILTAERLALNFMQRMSGIASRTRELVDLVAGTGAVILDTRKTTPGMRMIEKWAVKIGGGENHRFGLFDMILLKDNHIDFAGGIGRAVEATKKYLEKNNKDLKIEVETRNLAEVEEALKAGADVIMFDNMDAATLRQAVEYVAGRCKTEASGGITRETIRAVAETGVDYISVGALTHSAKSLDMSLLAVKKN